MLDVILDTNHWIALKENQNILSKFEKSKRRHGFNVLFTRPNFIDLAKWDQQDTLSDIIAEITDTYVVVEDYNSDGYHYSDDPLLIPPPEIRDNLKEYTLDFGAAKTLRFLFRSMEQDPDEGFSDLSRELSDIHDEGGESYLKMAAFWRYVERDDDRARVELSDASKLGYVRRQLTVEHAKQIQPNENIETQDYVDMEICAYAIYASDAFVGEKKWINQDIIPNVCEGIEGDDGPILMKSLDEFFAVFPEV
ncbi:hypothetical protein [Halorarum halobium]|uniref:hypothetical protein n=1 Tax=Halorarum halobium TaxID=3075121 RepID=UPI0028B18180|nr:hypothetical protein [Halobaculum sp. XH14]